MKHAVLRLMAPILLALVPGAALAQGAWQTFIRPFVIRDVLAEQDTVWIATREAGVLRYTRLDDRFTSFTRDPSGLSSNDISALARDRSGNLWAGTNGGGVSRLSPDGTWRVFNQFDGIPSDSIDCLTVEGDTLWIGSTAGIAVWNGFEVSGRLPDGFSPSPFNNDHIVAVVPVGDSLWVFNSTDAYVSRISTGLVTWALANENLASLPGRSFSAAVRDGPSLIAKTGNGALVRRSTAPGAQWAFISAPIGFTEHLIEDGGAVMATSESGIHTWSGSAWTNLDPSFTSNRNFPGSIYAPAIDPSGRVWVANQSGLFERLFPASGWSLHAPPGPAANEYVNVLASGGKVYANTYDQGATRYDGTTWKNWTVAGCALPSCDPDTTMLSPYYSFTLMADRAGRVWYAPWGTSISALDDSGPVPSFVHYTYANDLHTRAWGGAVDSAGGRWFGMDTDDFGNPERVPLGLEYYDPNGNYAANYQPTTNPAMLPGRIHAITTDRTGKLWIGSIENGMQIINPALLPADAAFSDVPDTGLLSFVAMTSRGDSIYAMTTRDVRIYYRPTAAFKDSFLLPAEPSDRSGSPLLAASDGTIYVGTANGIRTWRPGGAVTDINSTNSPLANDAVRAIREDPATGAIWIGTASGLHRYDPHYTTPVPPPPPTLKFRVYPNPSWLSALGVSLRIAGNASRYDGDVYDLTGRRVHRFQSSGSGQVVWDGRDTDGNLVHPGIYFLEVRAGSDTGFARIVLLR